jgi:flavin-dependent dehydrogenase
MKYDVLIYGGTVAGIAAALASSRMNCSTVLVERGDHLGGMMASGLGAIDTLRDGAFGGIFREFLQRCDSIMSKPTDLTRSRAV